MISCCLCDFQAFSKGNLSFHLNNVHFKDKEFMCRLCHFKTAYKGALTRHVNSVHLRTGKTKECPICGYVTASLLNLNNHLNVTHHLEIATAFARPSNMAGGPSTQRTANGTPEHPGPPESDPRQGGGASPPRGTIPLECRICAFQAHDNTELIMHYNLIHLNSAHAVLSRDSVVNAAAAAAKHLPGGHNSPGTYLPSGEDEPRDFSVIRDSEILLRRRGEELLRRQEILDRIEHSRLARQEELVAHLNTSARLLQHHHHHHQTQMDHQRGDERLHGHEKASPPRQGSPLRALPHNHSPPGSPRRGSSPGGPAAPPSRDLSYAEDVSNALRCRLCPFQAASYIYLKNHIRTAHLDEVHTLACPLCEYTSDQRADLETHVQKDHPQKYSDKRSVIIID